MAPTTATCPACGKTLPATPGLPGKGGYCASCLATGSVPERVLSPLDNPAPSTPVSSSASSPACRPQPRVAPDAIISLISGILGLSCLGLCLGPVAIAWGRCARAEIRKNPALYTGYGMATAGVAMGCVGFFSNVILLFIFVLASIQR